MRVKHGGWLVSVETDWGEQAKRLLKSQLKAKGCTYADLARRLSDAGSPETEANVRSKIARGRFTAAFLLESLHLVGSDVLK